MTFRLYFNRCEDWPQIWSIDSGDVSTEANVVDWRCEVGVTMRAGRAAGDVTAREPRAWCEVRAASCRIEDGVAVFRADPAEAYDAWPRGAVKREGEKVHAHTFKYDVCADDAVCDCGYRCRWDKRNEAANA